MTTVALDDDLAESAPDTAIDIGGGLTLHDCNVVIELRDRLDGHPVCDQDHWNAEPARCHTQRDAVRIAVAGYDGELKSSGSKQFDVALIVEEELDETIGVERAVSKVQEARGPSQSCERLQSLMRMSPDGGKR